ncbi:hypothetical protein Pan44_01680 [Caulifigura coniformis]|uniref:Phage protein, HK97 gp10 family n=1 Tax=Caulifigura coniformis TaxID=2527983 RepID=A0A517S7S4_9PLAN|nr:hypothetical protein [Caulifigura coniformis]QDT52159.1 hypothetical protein Pan44_01680 [Caulifigura coniformis]
MQIRVQVDGGDLHRLRELARYGVPDARRTMVERGMEAALESTIQLNPVDTGRSRAAWKAALDELRGEANGAAAAGGPIAEGLASGSLNHQHEAATTTISATNTVRYVPFLEYGTTRMTPFQMVRRSLASVRGVIAGWFQLGE